MGWGWGGKILATRGKKKRKMKKQRRDKEGNGQRQPGTARRTKVWGGHYLQQDGMTDTIIIVSVARPKGPSHPCATQLHGSSPDPSWDVISCPLWRRHPAARIIAGPFPHQVLISESSLAPRRDGLPDASFRSNKHFGSER